MSNAQPSRWTVNDLGEVEQNAPFLATVRNRL